MITEIQELSTKIQHSCHYIVILLSKDNNKLGYIVVDAFQI